jgi:phosphoadenosine phosphosulfate reductase
MFNNKIWDKENNGVLLTMKSSDEALNVPPRPVFFEELDLLGLDKHWDYPKSKAPLLWACDRRYYYCGELVLEAKGGNIYDDSQLIFTDAGKKLKLKPINETVDFQKLAESQEKKLKEKYTVIKEDCVSFDIPPSLEIYKKQYLYLQF